jgi:predicted Zn finger-like uncharacterized protein
MRIRCPSCSATYEVADALLDPPRTVRCAKCAHEWMAAPIVEAPLPVAPDPEPDETAVPAHAPVEPIAEQVLAASHPARPVHPEPVLGDTPLSAIERLAAPTDLYPRTDRRGRLLTAAWAASFAALAALGVAGYKERDLLMKQWPASKRVYVTLGLVHTDTTKDGDKTVGDAKPAEGTPAH